MASHKYVNIYNRIDGLLGSYYMRCDNQDTENVIFV